jgi:L-2-hydroxyglutarate oxidase LhgO
MFEPAEGLAPEFRPRARFAKGTSFTLAGRAPSSRLIYPVPEPGDLGVHLTLGLAGQARFEPILRSAQAVSQRRANSRASRNKAIPEPISTSS